MKSPFKFLDAYTITDREVFFGRDHEITELYRRVFESKMLLVYGISGTGKSSLVNCGLASRFDESDWLPVNIRRGNNIIESLNDAFNKEALTSLKKNQSLSEKLQSIYLDHFKPVYLLFDQFEELFIFGSQEEKSGFIKLVKEISESETQCRIIFIIREEFLAGMTEFESELPNIFTNRFRVEKMKRANAINAVEGPCKVFEFKTETGFSEELIDKLCPAGNEIELTYLQIYLDRIFRLATNEQPGTLNPEPGTFIINFSKELLTKTGSVSDLLGQFLDEQVREMDDPETGMSILKSFVSVQGTKKQMTAPEIGGAIKAFGAEISEADLIRYLEKFVELRILRERDEAGHYELRHDALAAKIYEKFTLSEKELLEVRQFVENAYANFEKRKIFLGTDDLNYIAPYADKLFVNKKLAEFIDNSRTKISARQRAFKRILGYSTIGFLIIIISVVLYYFRSNIRAKSRELTIEAFLQREFSPSLSLKTAIEAYRKDTSSTIAIKAMFDSFYELLDNGPYYDSLNNEINPQEAVFDFTTCNSNILYAGFSQDGKYVYGYLEDNTVNIWDIKGRLLFSKAENQTPVVALNFAPDNEFISALYLDSTAIVWNIKGEIIYKTKVVFNPVNPLDVINFSPSENIMTCLSWNNKIIIHNLDDNSDYELTGHSGEVNGAVFSPDGKFIASASKDSSVIIWLHNNATGIFNMTRKLTDFSGPIWSVDFARNSKYVLCLSDSIPFPLTIKKISGEYRNFERVAYFEDPINDSSLIRQVPWAYYGKYYSAHFTANDAAIRISTFIDSISPGKAKFKGEKSSREFDYHRIIYSHMSLFSLNQLNKYMEDYGLDSSGYIDRTEAFDYFYDFVDVSAKYIAANISGKDFSTLFYQDQLPIRKFKGTRPCFSPDGTHLLCIDNKNLKLYPSNEKELIRLYTKELIFGNTEKDKDEWRHFFKDD